MWRDQSVAVILPTYREKASIRSVIEGFAALGIVDDILVIDNNAEDGTAAEVEATAARLIQEPRQGYGAAIRRGIAETDADLVCICEPDGTFDPADLQKLLAYQGDFEFVYGSRTVPEFIWDNANMGRFLRWGNWGMAKVIEFAYNTPSLSDVGCTLRLANGDALRRLSGRFTIWDGHFGPEMMLLSIIGRWRVVQIPVNYRARAGRPGTTENPLTAFAIGMQMLGLILRYRVRRASVRADLVRLGACRDDWPADEPRPGGDPIHMFPWASLRRTRRARGRD